MAPIRARTRECRRFFEETDRLGLRYLEIIQRLREAGLPSPSYRTLQDWRRGVTTPRLVPLHIWLDVIRKTVSEE